jgi:hypothetical protein
MSALNKRFKNGAEVTLVTTDYDTLRIGLTAQHQLNARIARDVIGAPSIYFNEDSQSMERIWSPDSWWLTEEGWKATIYTVKRLIA